MKLTRKFLVHALRSWYSGEGSGTQSVQTLLPPGHEVCEMARGDHVLAGLGGPHPAGAEARGRGDSLTRIDHEETTNKLFGGLGNFEVVIGEGEITAENVVDRFLFGVVEEWRQSTE